MSFPAGLEAFFASKDGLKVQSPVPGPSETKATVRVGSDEKEAHDGEAKASSPPQRSASPCTSCPMCSRSFPIEVMENLFGAKKV